VSAQGYREMETDQEGTGKSEDDYSVLVDMMSQDVALYLKSRVDGFDVRQSIRAVDTGKVDNEGLPVIAVAASTEEAPQLLWRRMSAGFNQGLLLVKSKARGFVPRPEGEANSEESTPIAETPLAAEA